MRAFSVLVCLVLWVQVGRSAEKEVDPIIGTWVVSSSTSTSARFFKADGTGVVYNRLFGTYEFLWQYKGNTLLGGKRKYKIVDNNPEYGLIHIDGLFKEGVWWFDINDEIIKWVRPKD